MFARLKKSGKYEYLQIVETYREDKKVRQRVLTTLGRMDQIDLKGGLESLIRSLAKFSRKNLLLLSSRGNPSAHFLRIGPALIFERLWKELRIDKGIERLLKERKFEFNIERAVFLTTLHRLFVSGSDRDCDKWRKGYKIRGAGTLELHHLYRAMAFLGEELADQTGATQFSPRCVKDQVEEFLFSCRRDLFTGINLVFFDTTSIYFEGAGGDTLGRRGYSKDHRPDLKQMIVGAVLDTRGHPICCEMWPGNTADVKTILPVAERIRSRFGVNDFCLVADRGMISAENQRQLEDPANRLHYILGARMRRVTEVRRDVLSRAGRYREVHPETDRSKDPVPLKVKEVQLNGKRYIVCLNPRQARKDAADREAIIESLKERLRINPKGLIANKGYRPFLKVNRGQIVLNEKQIASDQRFDGKWVLTTNTDLPAEEVALKYKDLWMVEHIFRDMKSTLQTRPIFHKTDETIRGHVFCSFLALVLRKELERRLAQIGVTLEWNDIKRDLRSLQEAIISEGQARFAVRSDTPGVCAKVFQAVGVAMPPTIREI